MSSDTPSSVQALQRLLSADTKVKVAGIDVDGVLRGKYLSKDKFLSAVASGGFGFCSIIFGWDIQDTVYTKEPLVSNKANGHQDVLSSIDLSTFRRIPWEDNVPFFLVSFLDPNTKQALGIDPRGILQIIVERATGRGLHCYAGIELEYFNFNETPHTLAAKNYHDLRPLTPGMHGYSILRPQLNKQYFEELFDESGKFGISIEGHHTEMGPGVFETALAYTTALRMADNAVLFKYTAKSLGMKHGISPTFMAKPWEHLPGCGGHVHVSLRDAAGKNLFSVSESELKNGGRAGAAYSDTKFISQEAEWFLSGILDGLADVMPMLVPTINGYKRHAGAIPFWAPNAVKYGYDSRATSVRIISPPSVPPSVTRFEVRVPGADMNPHFSLSAIFALGMRGIEKKLSLPGPPVSQVTPEDKLAGKVRMLPASLQAATEQMMKPNSIAREVFGNEFVDHFGGTREHEVALWNKAVTDWEIARYFELA